MMKKINLAALALLINANTTFAKDIDCASQFTVSESWAMNLITSLATVQASFKNEYDQPVKSIEWQIKDGNGRIIGISTSEFTNIYGTASSLNVGSRDEILFEQQIRLQQLGMTPIEDENKREEIREPFDRRSKNEYLDKWTDVQCSLLRVDLEDGSTIEITQ